MLTGIGFEQASSLPEHNFDLLPWQGQTVFVARAPERAGETKQVSSTVDTWLLVGDLQGANDDVGALIRASGDRCVRVVAGDGFAKQNDGFIVDSSDPDSFRQLLAELPENPGNLRILYGWGLNAPNGEEVEAVEFADAERAVIGGLLYLVQAVVRDWSADAELIVLTRGAQEPVSGSAEPSQQPVSPVQSSLWSFAHSVALEHPELRCRRIDLDPSVPISESVEQLHEEISAGDDEDQIAFRQGERRVRRLARASSMEHPDSEPIEIAGEATYLVTGGLGGLGLFVAEWLVDRGARTLVLMGRSSPSAEALRIIEDLRARGATMEIAQGDISNVDDVQAVFDQIRDSLPPLRGIHARGGRR